MQNQAKSTALKRRQKTIEYNRGSQTGLPQKDEVFLWEEERQRRKVAVGVSLRHRA